MVFTHVDTECPKETTLTLRLLGVAVDAACPNLIPTRIIRIRLQTVSPRPIDISLMIRTDSRLKLIRGPVQCSSNSMHSLGLGRSHPFKGSEGLFLPQKCMVIMPGLQLLCIALHYRSYQLPNSGETRSSLHPSLGHYHHIEQ